MKRMADPRRSSASRRAYRPELVGGDVVFTDYNSIAANLAI
jgi:hypothetical protein